MVCEPKQSISGSVSDGVHDDSNDDDGGVA